MPVMSWRTAWLGDTMPLVCSWWQGCFYRFSPLPLQPLWAQCINTVNYLGWGWGGNQWKWFSKGRNFISFKQLWCASELLSFKTMVLLEHSCPSVETALFHSDIQMKITSALHSFIFVTCNGYGKQWNRDRIIYWCLD